MGTATKQQKKVPKIRFSSFSDEWQPKKLGDVGDVLMCKRVLKHQTTVTGDIPFFKIGTFGKVPNAFISKELYSEFKNKFSYPQKGEVLISAAGTIGRAVVFDGEPAYFQDSNIVWLDNNQNIITNPFLNLLYTQVKWPTASATIPRLYNSAYKSIDVNVPSIDEQQKIFDFLGSVNAWLDNLRSQKTALETYKRGMMQKLFTQQVRFKDGNGKEFPKWKQNRIDDVFTIKAGGDVGKLNFTKHSDNAHLVPVFANALKNNGLYGYTDKPIIEHESITVTGRGDIGHAVARKGGFVAVVRLLVLIPKFPTDVFFYKEMINRVNIFVESTGVPQLTAPQISNYKISSPCLEEQKKVSDFLVALDETITAKAEEITKVEQWKKGLMQKMFI